MNQDKGFITVERVVSGDLQQDWVARSVFIDMIRSCQWRDGASIKMRGVQTPVNRGQFVFGYRRFCEAFGYNRSTLERAIKYLESSGRITKQSDNKGSIITVCKYDEYQKIRSSGEETTWETGGETGGETRRETGLDARRETSRDNLRTNEPMNPLTREQKNKLAAASGDGPSAQLGLLDGEGSAGDDKKQKTPKTPEEIEKQARNIERAQWTECINAFAELHWVELGLKRLNYPAMDGKTRGRMNHKLDKLSQDCTYREAAGIIMACARSMAEKYAETKNKWWFPTPANLIGDDNRFSQLVTGADTEGFLEHTPPSPKDYLAVLKNDIAQAEMDLLNPPPPPVEPVAAAQQNPDSDVAMIPASMGFMSSTPPPDEPGELDDQPWMKEYLSTRS